jgi:dienelactone hydrolase
MSIKLMMVWVPAIILLSTCQSNFKEPPAYLPEPSNRVIETLEVNFKKEKISDSTYLIQWKNSHIKVHCKASERENSKGTILILPGWNHSTLFWNEKMSFCKKATQAGFNLVMPEMHKSNYTSQYFPETRQDMIDSPLISWLTDTLMEEMRLQFGFFEKGGPNYIAGLSSGARGAVLVSLAKPGVFLKGIAFSGDYDNAMLARDKVMINFYGPYHKFKSRWLQESNPAAHASSLSTSFFFIHGTADQVVLSENSQSFYALLKKSGNNAGHQLKLVPGQGHTYEFWDSKVDEALSFLQK